MKPHILNLCLAAALSSVTLHAQNLVTNGDFESGSGTAFYQTPPWYNCGAGFNQGANARSDKGAVITGDYSAAVIDRYNTTENKGGPVCYVQKTNYKIEKGDSFALSYSWRPADKYWQASKDTVRFVLFATANDKVGGSVIWSSELTSDFYTGKAGAPMAVTATTDVVNDEAVGAVLFVKFYGIDTGDSESGEPHWALVDNIEVSAVKGSAAP